MSVRDLGNGLGNALALPKSSAPIPIPYTIKPANANGTIKVGFMDARSFVIATANNSSAIPATNHEVVGFSKNGDSLLVINEYPYTSDGLIGYLKAYKLNIPFDVSSGTGASRTLLTAGGSASYSGNFGIDYDGEYVYAFLPGTGQTKIYRLSSSNYETLSATLLFTDTEWLYSVLLRPYYHAPRVVDYPIGTTSIGTYSIFSGDYGAFATDSASTIKATLLRSTTLVGDYLTSGTIVVYKNYAIRYTGFSSSNNGIVELYRRSIVDGNSTYTLVTTILLGTLIGLGGTTSSPVFVLREGKLIYLSASSGLVTQYSFDIPELVNVSS